MDLSTRCRDDFAHGPFGRLVPLIWATIAITVVSLVYRDTHHWIADNEVLVKVHAAGLNRGTWHFMTGLPYAARLAAGLGEPVEVSSPSSSSREGGGHLDVRPLWNAPG